MRSFAPLALVLVTTLAACERAPAADARPDAPAAAPSAASSAAPADSGRAKTERVMLVELTPMPGSGHRGEVELATEGAWTRLHIVVRIDGAAGVQRPHGTLIREGSCAAPGAVVTMLRPMSDSIDATRQVSKGAVSIPLATLADGHHIMAVHTAFGDRSPMLACGAIPRL